jgi:hypothetical protein
VHGKLAHSLPTQEERLLCAVNFYAHKITAITDVTEQEMVMYVDRRKGMSYNYC